MEEQPIDNHFKRKLHDAEIKPRAAAWAALEAKRIPKRTVPVWAYMAVAASLFIVGAFGWWAMQLGNSEVSPNLVAVRVASGSAEKIALPQNDVQIAETDRFTLPTISEQVQSSNAPNHISLRRQSITQIRGKANTAPKREANPEVEVSTQQVVVAIKTETPRYDTKPVAELIPEVVVANEFHRDVIAPAPERTLIVSINVPAKAVSVPAMTDRNDDNTSPKIGFGGLLKKVKQIKDGDVFALNAATTSAKTNRRGLGKFYDDVKESIKNNTAD